MFIFKEYIDFIKESKILEGSIMFFIGAEIQKFMHNIMKDIIIPLTKGDLQKLNADYIKYIVELIQIIITSFLIYILHRTIKNNI